MQRARSREIRALREQRHADETAGGAEEQIRLVVFQPVAAFAGRRSAVSNQFLPAIMVPASDRWRLEELARGAAEQGDTDALSLLAEINRAKIVPDRADRLESIVTMGSWVTYWADWGCPRETRQLVYPEKYTSDGTQIPVLSPLGVALIGLKVGSRMPFFAAGRTHIVSVERVSRTEPNVIPLLFCAPVQGTKCPQMTIQDQPPRKREESMQWLEGRASPARELPPIVIPTDEARRLNALANSNMALFPREAFFMASEMNRANVVPDNSDLRGVVHMGSQVRYCDHRTGDCEGRGLGVSARSPDSAETSLRSYSCRGGTDRPIGRPDHRLPNAGRSNAVVDGARYIKLFPERSPTPFVTANVDWPRDSVAIGCEDP